MSWVLFMFTNLRWKLEQLNTSTHWNRRFERNCITTVCYETKWTGTYLPLRSCFFCSVSVFIACFFITCWIFALEVWYGWTSTNASNITLGKWMLSNVVHQSDNSSERCSSVRGIPGKCVRLQGFVAFPTRRVERYSAIFYSFISFSFLPDVRIYFCSARIPLRNGRGQPLRNIYRCIFISCRDGKWYWIFRIPGDKSR